MTLVVVASGFMLTVSFGSAMVLVPGWSGALGWGTFFPFFLLRLVKLDTIESLPEKKVKIFFWENDLKDYFSQSEVIIESEDLNAGFFMKFERTTEKRTAWYIQIMGGTSSLILQSSQDFGCLEFP